VDRWTANGSRRPIERFITLFMEAAMTEVDAIGLIEAGLPTTTLCAEELHKFLLATHKIQGRARRLFIEGLLRVEEGKLYSLLGSGDIFVYSKAYFDLEPTATSNALRAAKAIRRLPLTLEALDSAKVAYSRVLEITKVATPQTEEAWIDLARTRSFSFLQSEVRDAKEKGRDHPRKDGHGLPGVKVKLTFDLAPQEHELTRVVIEKASGELSGSLGGERVDAKTAFLYIMKRFLETDSAGTPSGRREGSEPPYTVLYRQCPDCRRSHVATPDGFQEVEAEVVDRVAGEAERVVIDPAEEVRPAEGAPATEPGATAPAPAPEEKPAPAKPVTIDPPNTPRLTRRVLLRDGLRCANPCCRRACGLHGHHLQWRCHGGKTALWNEAAVCFRCHALIHLGLLVVTVNPDDALHWVAKGYALDFALEKDVLSSALSRIAAALTYVKGTAEPSGGAAAPSREERKEPADLEALICGLEGLGFKRDEARERLIEAHRFLHDRARRLSEGGKTPSEEDVVREALRRSVPRIARSTRPVPTA
jgi:hypothetical protein